MKFSLSVTFVILLLSIAIFNVPSNAFPSNTEDSSDDGSGSEDEQVSDVDKILALEGESINDSDNEYDIVHKVVIETTPDEMGDDDDDGEEGDSEEGDDEAGDDEDDDEDDDNDDEELDPTPYKKYKKWRGWRRHPLYVIILGG